MRIFAYLFLFSFGVLGAQVKPIDFLSPEKHYVDLNCIHLDNEGIFIQNQDQWVKVDGVFKDEKGFYLSLNKNNEVSFKWKCPKCDYENHFWSRSCADCGYTPPH